MHKIIERKHNMKFNSYFILILALVLSAGAVHAEGIDIHGFFEGAYGGRVVDNPVITDRDYTLEESRVQMQLQHFSDSAEFYGSVDFLGDSAEGSDFKASIREAYAKFGFGGKADVKIGRQIVTWGTGDLVFINDVFPKNYVSFFTGREDQYLKHPSDALRLKLFSKALNVDIVAIPFFDPDQMPTGQKLSYFNPLAGGIVGMTNLPAPRLPDRKFDNGEIAIRAYRYLGSFQVSAYFFRGFYKTPMGIDMAAGTMYYPELGVYGASTRGPLFSGVLSAEYGYYDSSDDDSGSNPLIPNSQHRFLVGFERQLWTDFTAGIQYYNEFMVDHDVYEGKLPPGSPVFDELRQVFTTRLTQELFYQTIRLSLFAFVSPTDEDWHLRPSVTYRYSDAVSISAGGNFFGGENDNTLFGQFEDNSNLYARVRYNF